MNPAEMIAQITPHIPSLLPLGIILFFGAVALKPIFKAFS
jgi:hypothetical protein